MDPTLKLHVLGAPFIEGPDGISENATARALSLVMLARLAVDGSPGTPRGTLANLLWPGASEQTGRHALSNLIYQTRRSLGRDSLVADRATVRLRADAWEVDYWTFRQAVESGTPEEAVATRRGPFLDGIRIRSAPVERWIDTIGRAIDDDYLHALESLAERAAARGDAVDAVRWLRIAVRADPLHSSRTRDLMLWLARSGDPAAAIRLAREHAELRSSELGLDPEPAVRILEDRIRSGDYPVGHLAADPPALPLAHTGVGQAPPVVSGLEPRSREYWHEEYLRALFLASNLRPDATEQAVQVLERVQEAVPDHAGAAAALARTLVLLLLSGSGRPREATLRRAVESAERAIQLDPQGGDAHATSAWASLFHTWDLPKVVRAVERARALGIHDPYTAALAAVTLSACGDSAGAREVAAEARHRDPYDYVAEFWSAWITRQSGGDALPHVRRLCERRPDGVWGLLLWALSVPEEPARVRALTQIILDLPQPNVLAFAIAAAARAQAGDGQHVERALSIAQAFDADNSRYLEQALVLSAAGRVEEAGDAFVDALRHREPNALGWRRDPILLPVLALPRVHAAARDAGVVPVPESPGPG